MRIVAIIQARMGSTRLPGKIAKPILGEPLLVRMLERVGRAASIGGVIVATSDTKEDDETARLALRGGAGVFRGSETDVLDRFYRAAVFAGAEAAVRLTGDCPLMDPEVIDEVVERFLAQNVDYTSTPANYPEGLDCEMFSFAALERAVRAAALPSEREHVTPYIKNHPDLFSIDEKWTRDGRDNSSMHWSVDTEADLAFVSEIFEKLYPRRPDFDKNDILDLLEREPRLLDINKGGTGYEGLEKSKREDELWKKARKN